jgi:hypothetical protein
VLTNSSLGPPIASVNKGKMNTPCPLAVQFNELIKKWSLVLNSAIKKAAKGAKSPPKEAALGPVQQLNNVLFRLWLWAGDVATKHGDGGPISTVATLEMLEAIGSNKAVVLQDIFKRMDNIASVFEGQLESLSDQNILDTAEETSHAINDLDMHRDSIREKISKFGGQYKSNKPVAILCFGTHSGNPPSRPTTMCLEANSARRRRATELRESARPTGTNGRALFSFVENPHIYVC